MTEKTVFTKILSALRAVLAVAAIWLFARYALVWLLPFIAAFLLARALNPVVSMLVTKLRFPRAVASALCAVLVFASAIALVTLCAGRAVYELTALAGRLTELPGGASETLSLLLKKLQGLIAAAPEELQSYIKTAIEGLLGKTAEIAGSISKGIFSFLSAILTAGPKILLFTFTCALGTFFISGGYSEITGFILRQIPHKYHRAMRDIKNDLLRTFGKWIQAQLMLAGVTFAELLVLFTILRIDFAIVLALIVAVVDMLPVVGTGIVLIPWGIYSLIIGQTPQAALLFTGFAVILLVRNILEPKLVAGRLGLPPIAALTAMYVGFCVAGIVGMALFPIGLIMLKQLNDKGYIRLWK